VETPTTKFDLHTQRKRMTLPALSIMAFDSRIAPMNTTVPTNHSPAKRSIKTVLFAALGVLTALFVASIVWKGQTTFSAYSTAIGQKEFDRGANRFIKGLFEVLMERLATNNGLQGADPAPATVLAEI
jgi:hypothetical protein